MERRSTGSLSIWHLSRKFQQGRWDPVFIDSTLTRIASECSSQNKCKLLKFCLATTPFALLPDTIFKDWPEQLLKKRWSAADTHLAALLCTCLLCKVETDKSVAQLLAEKLYRDAPHRILGNYPTVLNFFAQLQHLAQSESTLTHSIRQSQNLNASISSLTEYLASKAIKSVAVVGNAPQLLDGKHGLEIDGADCVIRFNNIVIKPEILGSTGKKTDIRVFTPGFKFSRHHIHDDISKQSTPTAWLSGYLPYKRASKYWRQLPASSGVTLLESEHSHWLELVQICKAPPSSGLLVLQALAATSCQINAYGFSKTTNRQNVQNVQNNRLKLTGNHYGDNAKRSSRHNWAAESEHIQALASTRITLLN